MLFVLIAGIKEIRPIFLNRLTRQMCLRQFEMLVYSLNSCQANQGKRKHNVHRGKPFVMFFSLNLKTPSSSDSSY